MAGVRRIAGAQRIDTAELEAVDAGLLGEIIEQTFVRNGGLRHAEAAEGAGGRVVGENGAGAIADMRHAIGAGGVHGHPAGHRRAPGGVGASVEVGVGLIAEEAAGGVARRLRPDHGGVALGGRGHGFDALVDAAHRVIQVPRGDGQHGLDRDVELAAEAAAAGRRNNAHAFGGQAEHAGDLVAVHHRRLGAGGDLDAVADPLHPAGLGLDVGVLDERGFEAALRHMRRLQSRGVGIAGFNQAARQNIVRVGGVQCRGTLGKRGGNAVQGRQRFPGNRQLSGVDRLYSRAGADERQNRLTPVAHMGLREHRLVLEVGIDAERILARHIGGREDAEDAGMALEEGAEIADREPRVGMRRAHRLQPVGIRRARRHRRRGIGRSSWADRPDGPR